ncbi:hypothetical protein DI272_29000 [Streptomyces sp. Act143]|uniref:hypothetical protein n=1 Tax=Streptomyces sp. Act143 TaxID=2200760 RepID=UPI000D67BDB6|nr:hypothetical protein [Streptomyces sp. Act143]PWI17748.1 hypothetical protein DI272_29000 [Streptomyces sp. Act143]
MPVDQHSDPFEDRVAAELRAAGGGFEPDLAALTTAGLARGRRLRLRRRAAVVGGAASLALVGVGGALLLPGGGAGPHQASVAAGPSATPTVTPTLPAVSDQELIDTLKEQLGYGKFSEERGSGTADKAGPYAALVWDDGDGAAAVAVSLNRVQPGGEEARQLAQCPDKLYVPYDDCKSTRLDNGSVLKIVQGYEYPDKRVPTKWWYADLVSAEGQHVSVSEWNAAAEKDAPVTRDEPPLDNAELQKLATAPAWLKAIDAIPGPPPQEPEPTQSAPVTDVAKKLVDLLPDGVQVVSRSGDEGEYGYVVVDDGKGKSLVEINVQPNSGDLLGESMFDGAEEVGDGTMLVTHEDAGDKDVAGAVRWTVDTVRINGLRVVISAYNQGGPHDAPGREKPALTIDQLKTIALSSAWGPSREESLTGQKNSDQG